MSSRVSIKKNFIMNAILTMSAFIFPLITFPYVSRVLQPEGTGKVAFATSLITYFNMISNLGIPTYGIRACAQVRDDKERLTKTVQELLLINIITTIVAYLALSIALLSIPKLFEDRTLYLIVSLNIILSTIGMEWLYKGLEQYSYITIRSLIFKAVSVILMFLLVHEKSDYVIYGGITIFAASASNVLNFFNSYKYISLKPVGSYNLKKHMKPVLMFFAMTVATTIYTNLDTVMLKFLTTDIDVGYYNAAVRIKTILVSIVTSLGAVLLPRSSYYVEHHQMDEFKRVSGKAIEFVFIFATPLMLFFMLFAREGIYLLSGTSYKGSIIPMQIIMPTLLFIGLSNITGMQILVPLGKEKIVLYSEIAGAITDFVINMLLIPKYSSSGAALGTVIAELVVLLVQYCFLKKYVNSMFRKVRYWIIILAMVLSSLSSTWVKGISINNFFALVIAAVLFFGVYVIVLLVLREPLTVVLFKAFTRKLKLKND